MDLDAIFDGKDSPAPAPEPQPAEVPAPPPEQAEQPAPDAPPEAPPPAPAPAAPETDRMVPLTAMLDTRDKLKAAERELAELRAAQQRQPAATPDPYDDPEGFRAAVEAQVQNQALSTKFDMSESMAREKHGDDAVTAAMEWGQQRAQTNPAFATEFLAQKHPIDWVVRQQKRDGLLSEVGDDPDAYVRRRAAELGLIASDTGAAVVAVPGQQLAPKPPTPPRSIANAASSGGHREVSLDAKAAMDAIFTR